MAGPNHRKGDTHRDSQKEKVSGEFCSVYTWFSEIDILRIWVAVVSSKCNVGLQTAGRLCTLRCMVGTHN